MFARKRTRMGERKAAAETAAGEDNAENDLS